jgi:predicted YcjX-like family ATPase
MTSELMTPASDQHFSSMDFESMDIEQLMQILDQLGIGFYETLTLLLAKLSPSQKSKLMKLVKQSQLGDKSQVTATKQKVVSIKQDPNLETVLCQLIILLGWRAEKKHTAESLGGFARFGN